MFNRRRSWGIVSSGSRQRRSVTEKYPFIFPSGQLITGDEIVIINSGSDHVYRWSILHDKRVQTEQVQNFAERTVLTNISTRSRLIRKTRNRT